jgi:hypothetical protein
MSLVKDRLVSGRIVISDLRPFAFPAAATISAVMERIPDLERGFLLLHPEKKKSAKAKGKKKRRTHEKKCARPGFTIC